MKEKKRSAAGWILEWAGQKRSAYVWSVVLGFLSYFGMMIDYKPSFERTVKTTKDLNDAAVEYIDGIEVIKAFGKTESSYAKFTKAAMAYADSFIS